MSTSDELPQEAGVIHINLLPKKWLGNLINYIWKLNGEECSIRKRPVSFGRGPKKGIIHIGMMPKAGHKGQKK
jgi:hypothetical protein